MRELDIIRAELKQIVEKEYLNLCRLYKRAKKHDCSFQLLSEIAEERNWMYHNGVTYPHRILDWDFPYRFKYAFKI